MKGHVRRGPNPRSELQFNPQKNSKTHSWVLPPPGFVLRSVRGFGCGTFVKCCSPTVQLIFVHFGSYAHSCLADTLFVFFLKPLDTSCSSGAPSCFSEVARLWLTARIATLYQRSKWAVVSCLTYESPPLQNFPLYHANTQGQTPTSLVLTKKNKKTSHGNLADSCYFFGANLQRRTLLSHCVCVCVWVPASDHFPWGFLFWLIAVRCAAASPCMQVQPMFVCICV